MKKWLNPQFKDLNANAKLLFIFIEEQKEFELSMKVLLMELKPLNNAEIKAAFSEIKSLLTFSHDQKKVSVKPLKPLKKGEQVKLLDVPSKNPPLSTIEAYFVECGSTKELAKRFFNHYESNGWRVGKNPLVKWRAAASNFMDNPVKNNSTFAQTPPTSKIETAQNSHDSFMQSYKNMTDGNN